MKCFLEPYKIAGQQFGITPDLHFLDLGRTRREALAFVFHGIAAGWGLTALISRLGLGKTALLRPLSRMVRETARTAFLFQSQSTQELRASIWTEQLLKNIESLPRTSFAHEAKNLRALSLF